MFCTLRNILFIPGMIGALVACINLPSTTTPISTIPPTPNVSSNIGAYLTQLTHDEKFSGAVLVARQGEVLVNNGYGFADVEGSVPVTPEIRFLIGSMDKQFTAMAVLMLYARDRLILQDPICDYMADCPLTWQGIAVHDLLTHSAGIADFPADVTTLSSYKDEPLDRDEIIAIYKEKPVLFSPGERFSYSTPGYLLLEHLVEEVSHQPFSSFLEQNIFEPLEMKSTDYDCRDEKLAVGFSASGITSRLIEWPRAYSICTTVEDLYLWDQSLYSDRLVPSAFTDLMFTAQVKAPEFGDMDYGYGWFVGEWDNHSVAGHGGWIPGSGFRSFIQRYPDDELLIVVLSNQSDSDVFAIVSEIAAQAFEN